LRLHYRLMQTEPRDKRVELLKARKSSKALGFFKSSAPLSRGSAKPKQTVPWLQLNSKASVRCLVAAFPPAIVPVSLIIISKKYCFY
jgi:hypothetical protein